MTSGHMWKLRAVAAAILSTLVVAGCGGGTSSSSRSTGTPGGETETVVAKEGGTLNVTNGEENISLIPLQAVAPADVNVTSAIAEPLWKENFEGKLVPWLVEKYETADDQKLWTIHLKPGIKFSDGKPMTSADVVFTLEKARESEFAGEILQGITSVKATSPSTVVIASDVPAPEMPLNLSQWKFEIVPKNYDGMSEKEFGQHPIGTGPFKFASWKKGESLTLEKNSYYWRKGEPKLEKIVFHSVEDPNSRASQLTGGELDLAYSPPWQQLEALEQGSETQVGEFPLGISYPIVLNTRKPLFKNMKVREAVNLALDREGIAKTSLGGYGETAGSYISPPVVGYTAVKPAEQDVEKAKELLAEAVKEGVQPKFTLMVIKEVPFWTTAVQIVQQNLEEIGFKVSIKETDASSGFAVAEEGAFDAYACLNYAPANASSEMFGWYDATQGNWSGSNTAEIEKLLGQAQQEVNSAKREQDWAHMQEILDKEKKVIQVAFAPYVWASRSDVTGFVVGNGGIPWFADTGFTS